MAHEEHRNLRKGDFLLAGMLGCATVLSRLLIFPGGDSGFSYDDGNFALAARSFSLVDTRPHLPGYYLHVQLIRAVDMASGTPFSAMALLAVCYSGLAAILLYKLLRKWGDSRDAALGTLLVVSNPLVWFYGCVPEIYAFDLFFSVALVYAGLSPRAIYGLPLLAALGGGIRPSSPVLLLPLYGYLWFRFKPDPRFSWKGFLLAHLVGLVALLTWLLPMLNSAGGLSEYLRLYKTHNPVLKISFLQNGFQLSSYTVFLTPPFIITAAWLTVNYFRRGGGRLKVGPVSACDRTFIHIVLWWVIPPLLFFIIYHYSKGYFMLCAAGMLLIILPLLRRKSFGKPVLTAIIVGQILLFLLLPYRRPDVAVYMGPETRRLSLAQVWLQRTLSHYLMARMHLDALKEFSKVVGDIIDRRNSDPSPLLQRPYLMLDPTCPVSVRALQAKYPGVTFAVLLLRQSNVYALHRDLSSADQTGVADMLSSAIILGRSDFVDNYLKDFSLDQQSLGTWTCYGFEKRQAQEAARRLDSLFVRHKGRKVFFR